MINHRELEYFFSALDPLVAVSRGAQDRLERKLAENFSVIDVMIRSQSGEKQLSAILGFLLNPVASHGQGTAFLDNFSSRRALRPRYTIVEIVR